MNPLTHEQVTGKVLDHLGLVASTIETLGLVKKVDTLLPLDPSKGAKISLGQRVAAMILNGLGFTDERLYMFETFLDNKPLDRLFGPTVEASHFNDDTLGRCLDAIAEYGVTKFFTEIAFAIGREHNLLGKTIHQDTTSLTVYGDYPAEREESHQGARPSYGYSKAHRPDLKQMVLHLATSGSSNFPVWMEAHSGNASDKKTLLDAAKRMEAFKNQLKPGDKLLHVGDSAFYTGAVK